MLKNPFYGNLLLFSFLDNSITGQTKLPTSTNSPKSSPEAGNTKITEISSSKDDDDLDATARDEFELEYSTAATVAKRVAEV